jgi:hypothetical protein
LLTEFLIAAAAYRAVAADGNFGEYRSHTDLLPSALRADQGPMPGQSGVV